MPQGPKFDYMDPDTWSRRCGIIHVWRTRNALGFCLHAGPSRRRWMFVKLIAAFSPIWAILAVLISAWEEARKPRS